MADVTPTQGRYLAYIHAYTEARYTDPRFMTGDFDDFGAIDYSGIRIGDLVSKHGPKLRMATNTTLETVATRRMKKGLPTW